jgi:hypothetical protein
MPDEPSDNDQPWWMPPDRPEPAERDDLIELGPIRSARPIGPMNLRAWSRRPYVLAGVAVAALLGGAGAALASTGSGTPAASPNSVAASPAPSPAQQGVPAPPGRAGHGMHWMGAGGLGAGGLFGTLHGQLVVTKPGGGYETVDVQNGQVTAVSTTSITLKSSDGFSKSYTVAATTTVDAQRDGIGSVKVGNQATVVATVSGSTATASGITDLTLLQQEHPAFGYGRAPSGGTGTQTG